MNNASLHGVLRRWGHRWLALASVLCLLAGAAQAQAGGGSAPMAGRNLLLGAGDQVRVIVFQNNDLALEARVDGDGRLTYPFLGVLDVGGKSPAQVERMIAEGLEARGVLKRPQVSVLVTQIRSQQFAVLGNVNRPGQFVLDTMLSVSSALAQAGGVTVNGADTVVLSRFDGGQLKNIEVDLVEMFRAGAGRGQDYLLQPGDVIFVHRAPLFYISGQVQRPGALRLERGMTVMQALSAGGGLNLRGTERGMSITRRGPSGELVTLEAQPSTQLEPDDVLFIRESVF